MKEWDIISFFTPEHYRSATLVGVGDDAAIVHFEGNTVISCDNMLEGVHFPKGSPWDKVGYRAVVAALSDLAAMAATPRSILLSITLSEATESICRALSQGILEAARHYNVDIIGGNTTQGPCNIGITVLGDVLDSGIRRNGAKPGDGISVTGFLGDAALGLKRIQEQNEDDTYLTNRFWRPTARFEMKSFLNNVKATSCIDLSDGLFGDLRHILKASQVGAHVDSDSLPLSSELLKHLSRDDAKRLALTGGEDYELCFTAPIENVARYITKSPAPITQIGTILSGKHYDITGFDFQSLSSYEHFGECK